MGFASQKGFGDPGPARQEKPVGTQMMHTQDNLEKRKGRNSLQLGPASPGDQVGGVTGKVLTSVGGNRAAKGVPARRSCLPFFIDTLTHSKKDLGPDWESSHLSL